MRLRQSVLAQLALAIACATPPHPWSNTSLCGMERTPEPPASEHEPWLLLLVRGYDRRTHEATTPAVDCTGAQVRWDGPAMACVDGSVSSTLLPPRPLGASDVVVSAQEQGIQLAWVITNRYASGDAVGPVAVVQTTSRESIVKATGVLRAYPERSTLRIEKIGKNELLVAEGERCASGDASSCHRAARVLPLRGPRFAPEPLGSEDGGCLSAAWFDLARDETRPLDSVRRRRYRLTASLHFEPTLLRIDEEIVVHDFDPHKPQAAPQLARRAHAERTVVLLDGRMVASGQSLWSKVVNAKE
jgi:hypothetical protein